MWILDELEKRQFSPMDAVIHREHRMTYAQLWRFSENTAVWLAGQLKTKAPVLIYGNKNLEIPAVMASILKTGRAYVPVDITFPVARLKKIADVTEAEIIFNFSDTVIHGEEDGISARILDRDEIRQIMNAESQSCLTREFWVKKEDVCYILFTSGSTGEPKGVQITRGNIENFTNWFCRYAQLPEGSVALNQVSYSFDVSVIQLYIYLAGGVALFCVDKEMVSDFGELFRFLGTSRIGAWVSTPAFIEMCAVYQAFDAQLLPCLRKVILAGEVLTKRLVRSLWDKFPGAEVINGYGPTEGTVLLTCCTITEEMMTDEAHELPIGEILDGGEFWLEDREHRRVAGDQVKGELVVSSRSISPGYFRNPEATAKNFLPELPIPGYRTGDLVYTVGSMIYYCGRIDFQIKLNGYRIELDDISENLNRVECISNSVVLPVYREGRVAYLAAFVVLSRDLGLSRPKTGIYIRKQLGELIPAYMVPKKIVVLKEFPLNTNGKIDRKLLLEEYL